MELNREQKKAVSHFEGPMMVLAGPGSGKTRVITSRVRFLIEEKGINPSNILVITFTKAAALQMRGRYQAMMPGRSAPVMFCTFHAIFFTILRHAYHYNTGNIIREEMRRRILQEIVEAMDVEISDENEFIGDLGAQISRVKGERLDPDNHRSPICTDKVFRRAYHKYQQELEKRRLIDFDDMLVYCYELLEQRPDIRRMWQRQYPHILIDEFQDINQVQYDVVKLLAEPSNNLFIVGDDDQSIYGFRGARPDIMQSFAREFAPARCTLNVNYRSRAQIIQLAGKVIAYNKNRMAKRIVAAGEMLPEDAPKAPTLQKPTAEEAVHFQEFAQMAEQNKQICAEIMAYHGQGIPYHQMAVLFRTNTQARGISVRLQECNIPFVLKEMIPNLYEHWIARDILTYIRVARGNRERANVMRIINRPKRYVHRNAFTEPLVDIKELERYYEDKDWMVERVEEFAADLKMLAEMRPYAAVNFIRRGIGYDEYIREYAEYREMKPDDLYEVLDELQELSKGYRTFEEWFADIQAHGEELKKQSGKSSRLRNGKEQQTDAVMLMTMHGAKGLEFDCVFIPDANEGVTPHNKAVLTQDMEEERRMFYVAMTRAKTHLHIYYLRERFNKEVSVSRFVEEILADTVTGSVEKKVGTE